MVAQSSQSDAKLKDGSHKVRKVSQRFGNGRAKCKKYLKVLGIVTQSSLSIARIWPWLRKALGGFVNTYQWIWDDPYWRAMALIIPRNINKCMGSNSHQYNLPLRPFGIKVAVCVR